MGVAHVVEKDREGGLRRVNIRVFTEFRHMSLDGACTSPTTRGNTHPFGSTHTQICIQVRKKSFILFQQEERAMLPSKTMDLGD